MTKELKRMLVIPTIGIIVVLTVLFAGHTFANASRFSFDVSYEGARRAAIGVQYHIGTFEQDTLVAVNVLANDPRITQLLNDGDRGELLEYLLFAKGILGVDYIAILDKDAKVIMRSIDPDRYGDILSGGPFEHALQGNSFFTYHSSPTTPIALQHSVPLEDNGEFIGVIAVGILLNDPNLMASLASGFDVDLTFYYSNRAIASTYLDLDDEEEVFADRHLADSILQAGEVVVVDSEIDDIPHKVASFPLVNSEGEILGFTSVAFPVVGIDLNYVMIRGIVAIGTALTVIAIFLLLFIVKKISTPIFEANERMWLMFNTSPTSIILYDRDLNVIDCNTKALELFGFASKGEALEHALDTLPPTQPNGENTLELYKSLIQRAFEVGEASLELACEKMDGTPLATKIAIVRMRQNDTDIVAEYTQDLTKIQQAEKKAQAEHEFNQLILNSAPIMITLRNSEYEIVHINQVGLDLMQVSGLEEYKREWRWLAPAEQSCGTDTEIMRQALFDEADRVGIANFEWLFQNKVDKELIPMNMTIVKFNHLGENIFVTYAFDLRSSKLAMKKAIEQEQQAEMALRESRAKSRFLAQISHEIRTPMNAVLGIAEIQLQNENLPGELKVSLSHIRTSSYLLLAIINNLLDLSKAEAGKMEIINKSYETISLIVDTVQVNMFYIGSKQIEFAIKVNPDLPFYLLGDELRIKQILNNCLSNSLKYTSEGKVTLSVDVIWDGSPKPEDGAEICLEIRIKDTGRGMTQDQVNQLFSEEYLRFNEFDSIEGSGLGMMITYQLITMMNGSIEVTSEVGVGTEVVLQIPQKVVGNNPIGLKQAKMLEGFELSSIAKHQVADFIREPMPYGRVLVVDDVELNIYVANGHLAPYRLQVDTALSGFETIEKINNGEAYDIIFMDHMMPEMDGIETVKILRENGYGGIIVALTANAIVGNAEAFKKQGFDGFVSKPIDIRELNQVLNTFVKGRHPKEAAKYKAEGQLSTEAIGETDSPQKVTGEMTRIFQSEANQAIITLRETLENEDIKLFTITAHAMKSALAYIGETDISSVAEKLENAGHTNDVEYIKNNANKFIETLETLLKKYDSIAAEKGNEKLIKGDVQHLAKQLKVIEAACSEYDIQTAVASVDALLEQSWKDEILESLQKMRDALFLESDFDAVLEMIEGFKL